MQARGHLPGQVEGTLHFSDKWPYNRFKGSGPTRFAGISRDLSTEFHNYSLEWTEEEMMWFVDTTLFHVQDMNRSFYESEGVERDPRVDFDTLNPYTKNGQPWDQPFRVILNLAVGGGYLRDQQPQDHDVWDAPSMLVDSVRVYERAAKQWSSKEAGSSGVLRAFGVLALVGMLVTIGFVFKIGYLDYIRK